MTQGKIILGAASAVITVGSALAFKPLHKFTFKGIFVKISISNKCLKCTNLWYTSNGAGCTKCHTAHGATVKGTGPNKKTFFTAPTVGGNKCTATHKTIKVSISI